MAVVASCLPAVDKKFSLVPSTTSLLSVVHSMTSLSGQNAVFLNKQKWSLDGDLVGKLKLRRILGPQIYKLQATTPFQEIATFWLTGGTNFQGQGYEVPYSQGSGKILPASVGCTVEKQSTPSNTVFTDVFLVSTLSGIKLIFRFSPTEVFPPTVEIEPSSENFTGSLFVMAPQPGSDQNLQSISSNYPRTVQQFPSVFDAVDINSGIPFPLKRVIGEQMWFLGIAIGGVILEGGIIALKYGDSGTYVGIQTSVGQPSVYFTEGVNVVPLPPLTPQLAIKFPRTFRWTATNNMFDIWIDPENNYPPTIRSVGPLMAPGSSLIVKIQRVMFHF